jgi:hypothetical protein
VKFAGKCFLDDNFYDIIGKLFIRKIGKIIMGRRVTLFLDDDLDKKLRALQAKTIKSTSNAVSYSRMVNKVIRNYFNNNS